MVNAVEIRRTQETIEEYERMIRDPAYNASQRQMFQERLSEARQVLARLQSESEPEPVRSRPGPAPPSPAPSRPVSPVLQPPSQPSQSVSQPTSFTRPSPAPSTTTPAPSRPARISQPSVSREEVLLANLTSEQQRKDVEFQQARARDVIRSVVTGVKSIPARTGGFVESLGFKGFNYAPTRFDETGRPVNGNGFFASEQASISSRAGYETAKTPGEIAQVEFIGGLVTSPLVGAGLFPSLGFTQSLNQPLVTGLKTTAEVKEKSGVFKGSSKTRVEVTTPESISFTKGYTPRSVKTETILGKQRFIGGQKVEGAYRIESVGINYGKSPTVTATSTVLTPKKVPVTDIILTYSDDGSAFVDVTGKGFETIKGVKTVKSVSAVTTPTGVSKVATTGELINIPKGTPRPVIERVNEVLGLPKGKVSVFAGFTDDVPSSGIIISKTKSVLPKLGTGTEITAGESFGVTGVTRGVGTGVKSSTVSQDLLNVQKASQIVNIKSNIVSESLSTGKALVESGIAKAVAEEGLKTSSLVGSVGVVRPASVTKSADVFVPPTTPVSDGGGVKDLFNPVTTGFKFGKAQNIPIPGELTIQAKTRIITPKPVIGQTLIVIPQELEDEETIITPSVTPGQIVETSQPIPPTPGGGRVKPFAPFGVMPTELPTFGADKGRTRGVVVKKVVRKYQPDLASIIVGRTGKQPVQKVFSGFEARPIIGGKIKVFKQRKVVNSVKVKKVKYKWGLKI